MFDMAWQKIVCDSQSISVKEIKDLHINKNLVCKTKYFGLLLQCATYQALQAVPFCQH